MKRLDLISNVAVIITSIALLCFLGSTWHEKYQRQQVRVNPRQPKSSGVSSPQVGNTIHLTGVDFSQTNKTLVIAISSTCHFCKESQSFYSALAKTPSLAAKLIAVLPMPQRDAEKYVHSTISPSLQVVSAPLDSMGVEGTPTLLLVDNLGRVEKTWVGKLDDAGEKQVQSQINGTAHS